MTFYKICYTWSSKNPNSDKNQWHNKWTRMSILMLMNITWSHQLQLYSSSFSSDFTFDKSFDWSALCNLWNVDFCAWPNCRVTKMGNLIWTSGGAGKLIRGSKAESCMRFQINWGAIASIKLESKGRDWIPGTKAKNRCLTKWKRYSQENFVIHILRLNC